MPFTPAHPAIILPFLKINKHYVTATGLIVGSVTPDFEYFINMSVKAQHSHTIAGLFYFDIPVGIALAVLFHAVVKRNFINNLPPFFQRRLCPLRQLDFITYVRQHPWALIVCLGLGAASHLLWDSFTHRHGFFVKHISFYHAVFPFQGVRYPMFYALQHISTYVGLLIVGVYFIFMKSHPETALMRPHLLYWMALLLISAGIVWLRFSIGHATYNTGNFVVSSITGVCCALVVTGLIRFHPTTP